jgi:galactokinase
VRQIERRAVEAFERRFHAAPAVVASAPGRVNLIGEHTDYSGGFVLPCAIDPRLAVAMGRGAGELVSLDAPATSRADGPPDKSWADYPRGVAWAMRQHGWAVPDFHAAFASEVPQGGGLSSSAAIEAATALALDALGELGVDRRELARLCQAADHGYVGIQSGIMDQYAVLLCQAEHALLLDCRSLEAEQVPVALDKAGLALLVCNTNVKRELRESVYNALQESCARAAAAIGVPLLRDACLADLARLSGEDRQRARHVIGENVRVLEAVAALRREDFAAFGRLMYASHVSLRDDYGVSTPELDAFVATARELGALGARLTGAGLGGCAIALLARELVGSLRATTRQRYAAQGFTAPTFYRFHLARGAEVVAL